MSMLILKGKGVFFYDEETGEKIPMLMPDQHDVNPFYINPKTGELVDQERYPHRWPVESVAHQLALDLVRQNAASDYAHALVNARKMINNAALRFNKSIRSHTDGGHALPLPFDDTGSGSLSPHWGKVNYGEWQGPNKHHADHQTWNENGLVTFHTNRTPHPEYGTFPESGALPMWKELLGIVKGLGLSKGGLPTGPGILPDLMVKDHHGNSPLQYYGSNHPDPFGMDAMTHPGSYQDGPDERQDTSLGSMVNALDPRFLQRNRSYIPGIAQMNLTQMGVPPEQAKELARTPLGSLFSNEKASRSSGGGFNNALKALKEKTQSFESGPNEARLKGIEKRIAQSHKVRFPDHVGGANNKGLRDALAVSLLAQDLGVSSPPDIASPVAMEMTQQLFGGDEAFTADHMGGMPDPHVPQPAPDVSGRAQFGIENTGAPTGLASPTNRTGVTASPPPMPQPALRTPPPTLPPRPITPPPQMQAPQHPSMVPMQQIPSQIVPPQQPSPFPQFRQFNEPPRIQTSQDSIFDLLDSLQIAEAQMDDMLIKSLPMDCSSYGLCMAYDITEQDIRTIYHSRGDWENIAKQLHIAPHVVRAVKLSMRDGI